LAYTGYLQVNWKKVEQQVVTFIDQDGDRKLTKKDLVVLWKKVKKVLVHQLPSTGRFNAGVVKPAVVVSGNFLFEST